MVHNDNQKRKKADVEELDTIEIMNHNYDVWDPELKLAGCSGCTTETRGEHK
jgi:hypothetical protein